MIELECDTCGDRYFGQEEHDEGDCPIFTCDGNVHKV